MRWWTKYFSSNNTRVFHETSAGFPACGNPHRHTPTGPDFVESNGLPKDMCLDCFKILGNNIRGMKHRDYEVAETETKQSPSQTVSVVAQQCPSCKGSGTYTGLFETSPCAECEGKKVVAVAAPASTAGENNDVSALATYGSARIINPKPLHSGDLLISPESLEDIRNWCVEEINEMTRKTMLETSGRIIDSYHDWDKEYEAKYGSLEEAAELTKLVRPAEGTNTGSARYAERQTLNSPAPATNIAAAPQPDGTILSALPEYQAILNVKFTEESLNPPKLVWNRSRNGSLPCGEPDFVGKHLEQCMRATAMRREALVKAALESGIRNPVIQVDVRTGEEKVVDGLPRMDDPRIKSLTCTSEEHFILEVYESLAVSQSVEIDV